MEWWIINITEDEGEYMFPFSTKKEAMETLRWWKLYDKVNNRKQYYVIEREDRI